MKQLKLRDTAAIQHILFCRACRASAKAWKAGNNPARLLEPGLQA